jgi:hypothetical protein
MLLQGFGGYTCGCASAPPRNSTTTRREEHPINKRQPLRAPNRHHRRGSGATVGDNHKGLLTNGKKPFLQNNQTQINPQIVKHTPHNHGPVQGGAHGPSNLSDPSGFLPGHPSIRTPASLEGYTPPRAYLRLARGLHAPSGRSPPRSRPPRPLLPDQSIKRSDTTQVPRSNAYPHHAGPLTPPGNHILALFHQPSL